MDENLEQRAEKAAGTAGSVAGGVSGARPRPVPHPDPLRRTRCRSRRWGHCRERDRPPARAGDSERRHRLLQDAYFLIRPLRTGARSSLFVRVCRARCASGAPA